MDKNNHAREAQLRAIGIYEKRPESALVINRGTAEVRDGLTCTFQQNGHRIALDMPAAIGGSEEGPSPGFFGRAAICGCLAIGIKMTAAREDLQLNRVLVEIEQDFDNRGILAINGASPVPNDTRITVEIESREEHRTVRDMVARALASDPWFLAFRDAQPVSTAVSFNGALI